MKGIGHAPFPITTQNPEVLKWFNQGNTLLHSFWWYEAERAFRWCLKLEPENAMAYWGLALAANNQEGEERAKEFLREAVRRKNSVTERERLFIEAWEVLWLTDPLHPVEDTPDARRNDREHRQNEHRKKLESLCLKYPKDVEARANLIRATRGNRYASELIIREIIELSPEHPGAHHYRVHNWDYHEPEQALESCEIYGELAYDVGHALHMPGHVYASLGMWHEAAIGMEAATRAEKRYMQESLTFPYDNWNYAHNLSFLGHLLEQIGMVELSISGSRQMIDAPLDPTYNTERFRSTHSSGNRSLARALLRYERWDEILEENYIPWRDNVFEQAMRLHAEARAHLAKNELFEAEKLIQEHTELDTKKLSGWEGRSVEVHALELRGRLALVKNDTLLGLSLLTDAAEKEYEMQSDFADPPFYPEAIFTALGEAYLDLDSPRLAVAAFEKTMEISPHDLFALSGMVRAFSKLGKKEEAGEAMERLLFIAQDADQGLAVIEKAKATGIKASPRDYGIRPQRTFSSVSLDHFGPGKWEPTMSPKLELHNAAGELVTLDQYTGKNVMLVFYLGEECGHCIEQLHTIAKKQGTWNELDTVVLAASSGKLNSADPGIIGNNGIAVHFMSDTNHSNARRFRSYDDFEDMELHSTNLIDKEGRIYWSRFGGDPFMDMEFLEKQLKRMNERVGSSASGLAAD